MYAAVEMMLNVLFHPRNVSKFLQVVDESTAAHERMDFSAAGRVLYTFFWDQFADWYIEAAKTRLNSDDKQLAWTTRKVELCRCRLHVSQTQQLCFQHSPKSLLPRSARTTPITQLVSYQDLPSPCFGIMPRIRNSCAGYSICHRTGSSQVLMCFVLPFRNRGKDIPLITFEPAT